VLSARWRRSSERARRPATRALSALRVVRDAPAPLLVVASAFSVQFGAALATTAFDEVGPLGFVWLRVGFAEIGRAHV